MSVIGKTLGALALTLLMAAAMIVLTALCLWLIVPVAFPALGFGFLNALGLSGLLYLAKAIFVVE